jgi:XRE family transcriptional regulator, aerobic/anaerobic benzoate catabolism transcriptional regulator
MSQDHTQTGDLRRGALPADEAYLRTIGERVRSVRAGRGMTRKILAKASGVSERYLADLEQGAGNASLLVLKQIADAMAVTVADLVRDGSEPTADLARAIHILEHLPSSAAASAVALLSQHFPQPQKTSDGRIALVGLRGAGKTTVGELAAHALGCPFIELDREIELTAGKPLAGIIADDGQSAFRKLELETLASVLRRYDKAVIATGGGLVTEPAAYGLLRASCFVVWLSAAPDQHMSRVVAQGDLRPMEGNPEAMSDLVAILKSRAHLYGLADACIDTTGTTPTEAVVQLLATTQPNSDRVAASD